MLNVILLLRDLFSLIKKRRKNVYSKGRNISPENASKRSIMLTFSVLISDGTRPQTDVKQAIEL